MEKKSLKELCTMRDYLKYLLEHSNWLGSKDVLVRALNMVEYHIKHYEQYQEEV